MNDLDESISSRQLGSLRTLEIGALEEFEKIIHIEHSPKSSFSLLISFRLLRRSSIGSSFFWPPFSGNLLHLIFSRLFRYRLVKIAKIETCQVNTLTGTPSLTLFFTILLERVLPRWYLLLLFTLPRGIGLRLHHPEVRWWGILLRIPLTN